MNAWNAQKKRMMEERGEMCELCRKARATDLDHAVYPKSVGKDIRDDENLILLCRDCHANKPSGYRRWAWEKNCERYGRFHMIRWNRDLRLVIKPRWE